MMRLIASLLLAGITFSTVQAQDYFELFEEAAAAINWNFEDEWAFTETRMFDDLPWVARFDPRKPEGERWALISVDERMPTNDELKDFAHDKEDQDTSDSSQRIDIVGVETLELIVETDEYWDFKFVPEEDEVEFIENVDAVLRIRKDGPYLESIDMRNRADIKPGFGTRISTFVMQLQFGPAIDGGPIVPHAMRIEVVGRALLFIGFDETELITYSEFEFAGNINSGTE
jgi:hypothetical protein